MMSTEHEFERRMIHAAHQRAEVTYQDRHDVTRTGTLLYWPSSTRPDAPAPAPRSAPPAATSGAGPASRPTWCAPSSATSAHRSASPGT